VSPVATFVGGIVSILIVVHTPFCDVPTKPKIFYSIMTFFSLFPLVFKHMSIYFAVDYFVNIISGNGNYFNSSSELSCKFSHFLVEFGDYQVGWLIALFTLERDYVVTNPFKANSITVKRTLYAFCVIAAIGLALNGPSFYVYIQESTLSGVYVPCNTIPDAVVSSYIVAVFVMDYFIPSFTMAVGAFLLLHALIRESKRIVRQTDGGKTTHVKGKQTAVVMVAVSTMRCIIYCPASICLSHPVSRRTMFPMAFSLTSSVSCMKYLMR
jgi:hypothetical protein